MQDMPGVNRRLTKWMLKEASLLGISCMLSRTTAAASPANSAACQAGRNGLLLWFADRRIQISGASHQQQQQCGRQCPAQSSASSICVRQDQAAK